MSVDIVERLRDTRHILGGKARHEAADEIERLRAELAAESELRCEAEAAARGAGAIVVNAISLDGVVTRCGSTLDMSTFERRNVYVCDKVLGHTGLHAGVSSDDAHLNWG